MPWTLVAYLDQTNIQWASFLSKMFPPINNVTQAYSLKHHARACFHNHCSVPVSIFTLFHSNSLTENDSIASKNLSNQTHQNQIYIYLSQLFNLPIQFNNGEESQ